MKNEQSSHPEAPLRVLHVVGTLNRGGVETWLVSLLRELKQDSRVEFEVVVQADANQFGYERDVADLGVKVHRVRRDQTWPIRFWRFLKFGNYDVVHSHRNEFSSIVLLIARLAGVKVRVAHAHSDTPIKESRIHHVYRKLSHLLFRLSPSVQLAVSQESMISTFGRDTGQVVELGMELGRFEFNLDNRIAIRKALGIADDAVVLGHVGSFRPVKNHTFLLKVFSEFRKKYSPHAVLLLVGGGPGQEDAERLAKELGIRSNVTFAGIRSDIPDCLAAMDVFVFPSLYEGLGLVVIEALASGLPVLLSDSLPSAIPTVNNSSKRLSLTASPEAWADTAWELSMLGRQGIPAGVSAWDIGSTARELVEIYQRAAQAVEGHAEER